MIKNRRWVWQMYDDQFNEVRSDALCMCGLIWFVYPHKVVRIIAKCDRETIMWVFQPDVPLATKIIPLN